MTTHFIAVEISLEEKPLTLQKIQDTLARQGEPLRWAVTQIDRENNTAIVEAVVTQEGSAS